MFLNPDTVIADSLETAFNLKVYTAIMNEAGKIDFAATKDFRSKFNGFYRVRQRSKEWYDKYFKLMVEQKTANLSFETLLREMYNVDRKGKIEVSFVSKLVATIDPNKPIWDKFVLKNLEKEREWERAGRASAEIRILKAAEIYTAIEDWYFTFISSENGKACIAKFDDMLPNYRDKLSSVRKIDFLLWSKR